ncbi:glutathione S-transferase family protein [Zestomonas insulae]|nr:glutathione S-transferase family protein [Pseudomonas insulae]
MKLYAHPFSSYCQKVLIALYENATPFEWRQLGPDNPAAVAEHAELWPLKRMPLLVDDGRPVLESSIIIEYLDLRHPGPVRLIPEDRNAALEVRLLDRFFDNYVMTPMMKYVFDVLREPQQRDPYGVSEAGELLVSAYAWLDDYLNGRQWAVGESFSLADCAAAPALFYADWVHPIDAGFSQLRAYRQRLLGRPSFARVVEEARPYRDLFPIGAPDQD